MVMGMAMEMEMLFLLRLGHFRCLCCLAACCLLSAALFLAFVAFVVAAAVRDVTGGAFAR